MKVKLILINPWIYDFSAVNLWARPLGILRIAEYLSQFDIDLNFIDCTDTLKTRGEYGKGKYPRHIVDKPAILKSVPKNYARYGISVADFQEKLKHLLPCDAVLLTSIMAYWYPGVQRVVEIINNLSPHTPVILGGIYATLFPGHALEQSGADLILSGQVNNLFSLKFSKPSLAGDIRSGGECGKDRSLQETLQNVLKNIGLKLVKKNRPLPYYKLGLYNDYPFAPLLTSSGCPFQCTYCASSALSEGFAQNKPSEVIKDIRALYSMGVRDYAFYDDALLVNADTHLKLVLKKLIRANFKIRFHCPNGLHAKLIDDELAYLMKMSGFSTLRLSLETVNTERQSITGGKITTDIFQATVHNLKKHGFTKRQIGVYLMYGLPGQELKEVEEGVDCLKNLGVRINLTEFSPIPGTSCWNELVASGTIHDNLDPLLTNNSVFSLLFAGYDIRAFERLKTDVRTYNSSC